MLAPVPPMSNERLPVPAETCTWQVERPFVSVAEQGKTLYVTERLTLPNGEKLETEARIRAVTELDEVTLAVGV